MVIFKWQNVMLSKADIEKYFIAEKQESLVFLVIGMAAILLALIFYFTVKTQVYRGAAIPLADSWSCSGYCRICSLCKK